MRLIIVLWIVIGIFNYGATFAYFQSRYSELAQQDRNLDQLFSFMMAIFGPIAGIPVLFLSGFLHYGWRIRTRE